MNAGKTAKHCKVANLDVTCQLSAICQYYVVANNRVVRHMHICHDPVSIAQARIATILHGTNIERAEFPYDVVVADFQPGILASILFILRHLTKTDVVIDAVAATNARMPRYDCVRTQYCAVSDFDMFADNGVRANLHVLAKLSPGMHNRSFVDHGSLIVHISAASDTNASSTNAWPVNFHIPLRLRTICVLIMS